MAYNIMSSVPYKNNLSLAQEFAAGSQLAEETIDRFIEGKMCAVPHHACKHVLLTESPADLVLLEPLIRAVIWRTGFPTGKSDKLLQEYQQVIQTVMALKHGDKPVNTDTNKFSTSFSGWTFHDHKSNLAELAHFTSFGPGLAWMPTQTPDTESRILTLGIPLEDTNPELTKAGDFVNFLPALIHSGPIATPEDLGQRHFATGQLIPAF